MFRDRSSMWLRLRSPKWQRFPRSSLFEYGARVHGDAAFSYAVLRAGAIQAMTTGNSKKPTDEELNARL